MAEDAKQVSAFVKHKIIKLKENQNDAATRAMLAKLRRGIGKTPGSMPELWEVTMEGMPEALYRKGGEPTRGEWAVHTALTLYALHQQGKDLQKKWMHQDDVTLGTALRKLINNDEEQEKRVKRRFDTAATSESLPEFAHHLRGVIQILKTQDIPLDYALLAKDLYWFQVQEARDGIKLNWGRDFYKVHNGEKATKAVDKETDKSRKTKERKDD